MLMQKTQLRKRMMRKTSNLSDLAAASVSSIKTLKERSDIVL